MVHFGRCGNHLREIIGEPDAVQIGDNEMKRISLNSNSGMTLIEVMWVAGIMSVGLVLLMSAVISVSAQQKAAVAGMTASQFNSSVLESLHGRDLAGICMYNGANEEFEVSPQGTIQIHGIGEALLQMYCVVPAQVQGEEPTRFSIPMTAEDLELVGPTLPNPLEVQVVLLIEKGLGTDREYKFQSSTRVFH